MPIIAKKNEMFWMFHAPNGRVTWGSLMNRLTRQAWMTHLSQKTIQNYGRCSFGGISSTVLLCILLLIANLLSLYSRAATVFQRQTFHVHEQNTRVIVKVHLFFIAEVITQVFSTLIQTVRGPWILNLEMRKKQAESMPVSFQLQDDLCKSFSSVHCPTASSSAAHCSLNSLEK